MLVAGRARAHEPPEDQPAATPALTAPSLVEKVDPDYPEAARRAGIGGTVSLAITVAADGVVSDVQVVRSAGFGLDEAAVAAARRFKFKPATDHGKPVASVVTFDQGFVVRPHLASEVTAMPPSATSAPTPSPSPAAAAPVAAAPLAPDSDRYRSTVAVAAPRLAASSTTVRNVDFDVAPRTSPGDLLNVVPGVLTVQTQGGGKADQIFLRGFDADHGTDVAIFVDGVPINLPSHAHGQGFADLHWLIPEAIDRIDVTKGPYDARYGDFATAGAIHLVTRSDWSESQAGVTLGSYPTQDGRVLASERFLGVAAPTFAPGGWASRLHPWIAFDGAHDDGPFVHPNKLDRYSLFAKLSYDLTQSTTAGIFFAAYGSQWNASGELPARVADDGSSCPGRVGCVSRFDSLDPSEGGLTERQMTTAFVHYKDGASEGNVTLYVTRYRLALWNDFTLFLEDPVHASELEQDDARTTSGLRMDYHFHRRWRGVSFRTTLGAEARWDSVHVDRFDAESQGGDFRVRLGRHVDTSAFALHGNDDDVSQENVAGFVEEEVRPLAWLRVVAALRADWFGFSVDDLSQQYVVGQPSTSGTTQKALLSPKASVVFTPVADVLDLYLNFGEGFHTNMAQVALLDGKRFTNPNNANDTFTARAVPRYYAGEAGARLRLWRRLDVSASVWASYLESETVFDADHAAFSPSSASRRIGFDLDATVTPLPWLALDLAIAQADARSLPDTGPSGLLALAPRFYLTAGATVHHRSGLRAGVRLRWLADRPAFDESSPEYQYFTSRTLADGRPNPDYDPSRVTAQGYVVVDAFVAFRWRFLEAALGIQNLLDSSWREAQFGNRSCTFAETYDPQNPRYAGSGNQLSDGSYVDRCGIVYGNQRSGVADVHFTPGVPIHFQATLKAYF